MTTPDTLDERARTEALALLTEFAGTVNLVDIIALAYMRGNVAGIREATVVIERTKPTEVAA